MRKEFARDRREKEVMPYIQLVEFDTQNPVEDVRRAMDAWLDVTGGQRFLRMAVVAADHDRPNHYWELLEFASEKQATKVADMPEAKKAYEKWSNLLDGEPTFHNLDVVEQVGGPEDFPSPGLVPWKTPGGG
jgi:hypothetical protein